ncbi:hypothetical protein [Synechococcus elongatus]|uniref:Uncharacterized protein n=2 Tax=Synechococcus elongatus TaxID=32046 RepID=A0AAN1QLD5_SYNEL|nr:hypothetical protein [Synechococcus elongatus]AZB71423.1 hypothetical protein DOP62_00605 [Synechococcus elongatus PCC 11801]QFZ91180.1 hypothetical protein EKO22_01180 [Synechococcus elongatus PCC 11802]
MVAAQLSVPARGSQFWIRGFLLWMFTFLVCFLVVGFPAVVVLTAIAALASVVLQAVMPISAVLLVSGLVFGGLILGSVIPSALLTLRGVHPQEVTWLPWLNGNTEITVTSRFAACPLTCELDS